MIHLSSVGRLLYALFYFEDGGITFLRNVSKHIPGYLASHPKRYYFSESSSNEPQTSHGYLPGEALLPTYLPTEGGSTFLRNVGKHVLDHTVSHPKRLYSFII
jgi:hypothetical protein